MLEYTPNQAHTICTKPLRKGRDDSRDGMAAHLVLPGEGFVKQRINLLGHCTKRCNEAVVSAGNALHAFRKIKRTIESTINTPTRRQRMQTSSMRGSQKDFRTFSYRLLVCVDRRQSCRGHQHYHLWSLLVRLSDEIGPCFRSSPDLSSLSEFRCGLSIAINIFCSRSSSPQKTSTHIRRPVPWPAAACITNHNRSINTRRWSEFSFYGRFLIN